MKKAREERERIKKMTERGITLSGSNNKAQTSTMKKLKRDFKEN